MTIITAAEKLAIALKAAGYEITNGATSNGVAGTSKYMYASIGGKSVKVRVSDHSFSNPVRMATEVSCYPAHDVNYIASTIRAVDMKLRTELFSATEKSVVIYHDLVVGKSNIDTTTDQVISFEGISKSGNEKYKIRRTITKSVIVYNYK